MNVRWHGSKFMIAMVVIAVGLAFAGTQASAGGKGGGGSTGGGGTLPAPLVEIVIFDGTATPDTLVACSELDCLGFNLPTNQWTWTVTEPQNSVSWAVSNWANTKGRITLYVGGNAVASARSGGLLVWNTTGLANGPYDVYAVAYNSQGTEGRSKLLRITVAH